MNSLNELKRKQIEIHEQYGSKYFIFIGPSNIKKATKLGIFERYVYGKIKCLMSCFVAWVNWKFI